ncbi:MAG TPA: hypothetical protein VKT30_16615 [Caulobacteraceae bacterium]|nr:hypothetical protein [Caulobacteraceae bacterium]
MLRRAAVLAIPVLFVAACQTSYEGPGYPAPPPPAPPPPPAVGGIDGQGAFHMSSGARVTCAGYSVALMPDYVRYRRRVVDLYGTTVRSMQPIAEVRARSAKAPPSPDTAPVASATCDAKGAFQVRGLQPGGYFLLARVKVRPAPASGGDYVILQPIDVQPGQIASVSLAP